MIQYIYFVKCPHCEDEPFDFFDEAKAYATSCLAKKPIITQVEVDRNDFGECVGSSDLGTIWSWEEMMGEQPEPEVVFSKTDLESDAEFDALDNSLATMSPTPVPSIDQLVEMIEENEDTVECKWCNELFDKSECRFEVDMGWLCHHCIAAIESRGETLTFREGPLTEAVTKQPWQEKPVELYYPNLRVTLQSEKRDVDDWDEWEEDVEYTYNADPDSVAEVLWDLMQDEDVTTVEGGFDALYDDDELYNKFMNEHFDDLVEKYMDQLLKHFEEDAAESYQDGYDPWQAREDARAAAEEAAWEARRDERLFGEGKTAPEAAPNLLEELEDGDDYRNRLTHCPACDGKNSFDPQTGFCIDCGHNEDV